MDRAIRACLGHRPASSGQHVQAGNILTPPNNDVVLQFVLDCLQREIVVTEL